LPPKTRPVKFTILVPIKYLSYNCIMTWWIWRLCSINRSWTSRCQICYRTDIRSVPIYITRTSLQMRCYLTVIQRILVRSQIWHPQQL
jgi:hypothetical protein